MQLERIEPRWTGRRCIVAAPGPSLTPEVAELCRGELVIAVNDACRLLPWAEVLYGCDEAWWRERQPEFAGERWTSHSLSPKNDKSRCADELGLRVVRGEEKPGFSLDPAVIHYGNNSGYQGTNVAILRAADPIILVGFDMRLVRVKKPSGAEELMTHFFGHHRVPLRETPGSFGRWIGNFATAAKMLGDRPRIVNATPGSALTCFPMVPLGEALGMRAAA